MPEARSGQGSLLGGCEGLQSRLNPAGEQARGMDVLFALMIWIWGGTYRLIIGCLRATTWRGRVRPAQDGAPAGEPADKGLHRTLLFWGLPIAIGLTVLIIASFLVDNSLAVAKDREAIVVRVTGHQWWWRLQYRDPATGGWIETANDLHLPLGRTARIELGSPEVIRGFWVPNISGKMDIVPGHINVIDVTPHREGWFRAQCAEFCGARHAHMAFDVKVDSPAAFDSWLADQARPASAVADSAVQDGMRH